MKKNAMPLSRRQFLLTSFGAGLVAANAQGYKSPVGQNAGKLMTLSKQKALQKLIWINCW